MGTFLHSRINRIAALLMKLLFGSIGRIRVLHPENAERNGGFLLAGNHISHFDPFIISSVVRRKIDWMATKEFFPIPVVGFVLRAVDAFPVSRRRADRATIRTVIERLERGRIIGLFPEGGIRDGARSLLGGAPLRPGAAALAHLAAVPVIPCVIVGSDRLYAKKSWLPFRRTPIWIGFGDPISHRPQRPKAEARNAIETELIEAFGRLYAEIRRTFHLTEGDLPHSPQERMGRPVRAGAAALHSPASAVRRNGALPEEQLNFRRGFGRRFAATSVDALMCASMNLLQSRHRLHSKSRSEMELYVIECEKLTARSYYDAPRSAELAKSVQNGCKVTWRSPVESGFFKNDVARADFFPSARGQDAPTVLMLHALMSASHVGYRRWAAHFNERGWNAVFVHLPYHYSRVPRGYWNGELAITSDLVRNAEGIRQGVMEVRQLIGALRECGCEEFGLLGTSYGGWIGALLAMVEPDFRFLALMTPIVNVEHAIWQSPAAAFIRRELNRARIDSALVARHFHLSSPMLNQPLCNPERILLVAGEFDLISRIEDVEALHRKWRGSEFLRVPQGHFGYRAMRETVTHLRELL